MGASPRKIEETIVSPERAKLERDSPAAADELIFTLAVAELVRVPNIRIGIALRELNPARFAVGVLDGRARVPGERLASALVATRGRPAEAVRIDAHLASDPLPNLASERSDTYWHLRQFWDEKPASVCQLGPQRINGRFPVWLSGPPRTAKPASVWQS